MTEFDYLGTAEKIAKLFPELAQFESPEAAMKSSVMTDCREFLYQMTSEQFFISCGIALTFNVSLPPADSTLDDVSDEYLRAHPEKQKQLDTEVTEFEKRMNEESKELMDP